MSYHLSARCHLEGKTEPLTVVLVQHIPQGDVQVLVPKEAETVEDVVASLILSGIPPQRIWPARLILGSLVSISARVAIP